MLKEFKEFAMRGNVMDMAVGIIIGGAFGKIITSLVEDVIMQPVGLLLGNRRVWIRRSHPPWGELRKWNAWRAVMPPMRSHSTRRAAASSK